MVTFLCSHVMILAMTICCCSCVPGNRKKRWWNLQVPIVTTNSSEDVVTRVDEYKAAVLRLRGPDRTISSSETIPNSLVEARQAAEMLKNQAKEIVAEARAVEARELRDILVEEGAPTELECSLKRVRSAPCGM